MAYLGKTQLQAANIKRWTGTPGAVNVISFTTLGFRPLNEQSTFITINGVKQHDSSFILTSSAIQFNGTLLITDEVEVVAILNVGQPLVPADNSVQRKHLAPSFRNVTQDKFSGNGSTTAYTLSYAPMSSSSILVFLNGVSQLAGTDFTVSSTTLTFTTAPITGTDNINVIHLTYATGTTEVIPTDDSVTTSKVVDGSVTDSKIVGMSSSKLTGALPAIDGSALTGVAPTKATIEALGIAASSITGALPAISGASLTSLTSANLSGALPAIDGGNLTGLTSTLASLTDATVSTTDPTLSANPSATGHFWVNKTSGETYICTDNTSGMNVWTNMGDGSGAIQPYSIDYLVIAGGGGGNGGFGGGGGAGGYRNSYNNETSGRGSASESSIVSTPGNVYTITVGSGGAGSPHGTFTNAVNGNDSVFGTITSIGGGSGNTGNGGSGGGKSRYQGAGGAGTSGQGYDGGTNTSHNEDQTGSGGGGAGQAGQPDSSGNVAGNGGNGLSSSITGSSVTRAGGGGGGTRYPNNTAGSGGSGGGGNGGHGGAGTSGSTNTGSGGGAGSYANSNYEYAGGAGGSGVVIIRMPTSGYSGTTTGSPTVSTSGSDTILTFNSSGTYTG
jgi:hypothetical protein